MCIRDSRSLLILKFYFVVFILYAFIDKLTNEQRDKPVESIFLVTYIIVPQDFFKFIDNFVIWREIAKVLFPKRFYPNLIGNGILGEDGSAFHRSLSRLHTWLMRCSHPDKA